MQDEVQPNSFIQRQLRLKDLYQASSIAGKTFSPLFNNHVLDNLHLAHNHTFNG
jgi:hypothetical protein